MQWEDVDPGRMERAKIHGGWLVRAFENVSHDRGGELQQGWDWRVALCFVPDPTHEWKIREG